ncbi:uncharacterized protein [Cherax quadricarinatus]|uniref:uncharacterized protein n=1 Tax=Cherax quadricarinatus TaxID=27406 RepID=UPI00387E84F8
MRLLLIVSAVLVSLAAINATWLPTANIPLVANSPLGTLPVTALLSLQAAVILAFLKEDKSPIYYDDEDILHEEFHDFGGGSHEYGSPASHEPAESFHEPVESSHETAESSHGTEESSVIPAESSYVSIESSDVPPDPSYIPAEASDVPSYVPAQASHVPAQSYVPAESSYYPEESSYVPVQVSYYPEESSYVPAQASYYPEESSYIPAQASYYPEESSYVPAQASYHPEESSYIPAQASYYPEESPYAFSKSLDIPSESQYVPQRPSYPFPTKTYNRNSVNKRHNRALLMGLQEAQTGLHEVEEVQTGLEEVEEAQKLLMSAATHLDTDGCILKFMCYLENKQQSTRSLEENVLLQLFSNSPETMSFYNTALLEATQSRQIQDPARCDKVFPRCLLLEKELSSLIVQTLGCGSLLSFIMQ